MYIDNTFNSRMEAWDTLVPDMHYGQYVFKMVQMNGYDSVPNIIEDNIPIDACTSISWGPK